MIMVNKLEKEFQLLRHHSTLYYRLICIWL